MSADSSNTTTQATPSTNPSMSFIWKHPTLTLFGDAAGDESGSSVALSSDGKILAVGAPGKEGYNDRPGYVKVSRREGTSGWAQLGLILYGKKNGDQFGASVSLSADGKTLASGAPGDFDTIDRPGYVSVYHMEGVGTGSSWKQLGKNITGEALGDRLGNSVSLSTDGKTLAIGANSNDGNGLDSGHVRIFSLEVGTEGKKYWKPLGEDIGGEASGDNSGWSVSLSADGKTAAIGALMNDGNGSNSGHVRVYHMEGDNVGSNWTQIGEDIDGELTDDRSGRSVSFSADGKTLAIGAPFNAQNGTKAGQVRVYHMDGDWTGSSWNQLGQDINGKKEGDQLGRDVSLSADGTTLAIGASGKDINSAIGASGKDINSRPRRKRGYRRRYRPRGVHARVYHMEGDDWKQLGEDIKGEAPIENSGWENAGWSVSLSADGKTVAVGSVVNYDNGIKSGRVKVFNWEKVKTSE
mmetsp:Transcript_21592/g.46978  ORF Transcript_21592/g.46978 Transcript_21592/m.46978 type:complete len:466 (-) Transcript_21592:83-1480(-)